MRFMTVPLAHDMPGTPAILAAARTCVLAFAILLLPLHFFSDGFGSLLASAGAVDMASIEASGCTQPAAAHAPCAQDGDPEEVSGTADASDYLEQDVTCGHAGLHGAGFMQRPGHFPASADARAASPPPRA